MNDLNRRSAAVYQPYPERILQFGGGNFLRAFVDWMIDQHNLKSGSGLGILVVTTNSREIYSKWQSQEGLYHVVTKGFQNGSTIDEVTLVKSVSRVLQIKQDWNEYLKSAEKEEIRFIISNTTESGIRFSISDQFDNRPSFEFPAKLTRWLYHRYQTFQGARDKGCIIIPTELIPDNGHELRECILEYVESWKLPLNFRKWIQESNTFCNSLVDRIVPGIQEAEREQVWSRIGYQDFLVTECEPFYSWIIEAPESIQKELPLDDSGLNVTFAENLAPYRRRKIRILNGAHTSLVPVGVLYGLRTVKEAVEHKFVGVFLGRVLLDEIIPSLDSSEELKEFTTQTLERFKNPFIKHQLMSISLNCISKFNNRVVPSIIEYNKKQGSLPPLLVYSLAALVHFYKGQKFGFNIDLNDDVNNISFMHNLWQEYTSGHSSFSNMSRDILNWKEAWDQDLGKIKGLQSLLEKFLAVIEEKGVEGSLIQLVE